MTPKKSTFKNVREKLVYSGSCFLHELARASSFIEKSPLSGLQINLITV